MRRQGGDKLLKAANAVVHALETTLLLPNLPNDGGDEFCKEEFESLIRSIYGFESDEDVGVVISSHEAVALSKLPEYRRVP